MVEVIVVARKPGTYETDFSLKFEVPEVPRIGDYISIRRLDEREPFGQDLIVRQVWWRLLHPDTHGYPTTERAGDLVEIRVECDPALGPYPSDRWRKSLADVDGVEEFKIARRL